MKFKVRHGIFETNSSSIHSIAIYKGNEEIKFPDTVYLSREDFGWNIRTTRNWEEKLNYVYEMCIAKDYENNNLIFKEEDEKDEEWLYGRRIDGFLEDSCLDRLVNILKAKDIDVKYNLCSTYDGSIDHCDCWDDFIISLLDDEDKLLKFIFGPESYLSTGNDNTDYSVSESSAEFDVQYKYN